MIGLMVNAINAIDTAHSERVPLPFLSCMVEDCVKEGKTVQEGGAHYNFTGPQGFGIANMADGLWAVKTLVFDEKKVTMAELKDALIHNYGQGLSPKAAKNATQEVVINLAKAGKSVNESQVADICRMFLTGEQDPTKRKRYEEILDMINELPKYGNDIEEIDMLARDVANIYAKNLKNIKILAEVCSRQDCILYRLTFLLVSRQVRPLTADLPIHRLRTV